MSEVIYGFANITLYFLLIFHTFLNCLFTYFTGCGGLSIGLERSGASKLRWAVENDAAAFASSAYKLNHPECQVIRYMKLFSRKLSLNFCRGIVFTEILNVSCLF